MNNLQEQQKELVVKKLKEQQVDSARKKHKELQNFLDSVNTTDDFMILDEMYNILKNINRRGSW